MQIKWVLEGKFIKISSITGKGFKRFNVRFMLKREAIRFKILSSDNRSFRTPWIIATQWRIQDFEKGGSTPTQMHSQALPARYITVRSNFHNASCN